MLARSLSFVDKITIRMRKLKGKTKQIQIVYLCSNTSFLQEKLYFFFQNLPPWLPNFIERSQLVTAWKFSNAFFVYFCGCCGEIHCSLYCGGHMNGLSHIIKIWFLRIDLWPPLYGTRRQVLTPLTGDVMRVQTSILTLLLTGKRLNKMDTQLNLINISKPIFAWK